MISDDVTLVTYDHIDHMTGGILQADRQAR